jgi:hypothetical protein
MIRLSFIPLAFMLIFSAHAQQSQTFEMRYYSTDPKANGETDFKGKNEYLPVEERVNFLKKYADYASTFYNDKDLNKKVVEDEEVDDIVTEIKPQPLPNVRRRILLEEWKWTGYRPGQELQTAADLAYYEASPNVTVRDGKLTFAAAGTHQWQFSPQSWRMSFQWRVKPVANQPATFIFSDGSNRAATITMTAEGRLRCTTSDGEVVEGPAFAAGEWHQFKIEFDLGAYKRKEDVARYNLYFNDQLIADYIPLERVVLGGVGYAANFVSIGHIDQLLVQAPKDFQIDDVWGVGYHLTGRESYPYTTATFLDEDFDSMPDMLNWHSENYSDTLWQTEELPIVHGSERHSREDLYLRKKVQVGAFDKAFLNLETLNPGGEIYINGRVVAVVSDRYPHRLDVSRFLRKNDENTLAVKVNHFFLNAAEGEIMPHSSLDFNIGWFAGRMHLDLLGETFVEDIYVHTTNIEEAQATLRMRIPIRHTGPVSFRGKAEVKLYPWFPTESASAAVSHSFPVVIGHGSQDFVESITVPDARLWTDKNPNLYKVEVRLLDEDGKVLDDGVETTGIRTLSQKNGTFHLNGKPYMLNGAQIMGFRGPLENMIKWVLCPPEEWIVREMMMIKKMNGNLLRVHVHGWEFPAVNINDPRYPEIADQLGMMMIWGTPAWVRTGKGWGQIDWEGYPTYMKEVFNHPSIVIWETANHTQSFKGRDVAESNMFSEKAYETVYPVDSSRLISFNSYVRHLHYGNDAGTIDQQGNPITPSYAWTAPMVTRGNQDGIVGYSNDWTNLRTWPDDYIASFLNSPDRAYFNFEHEESMAQPNWNLVKGKPWYRLHSYEWEYDEGTIGRRLSLDEWRESQGWQAFSAWEAMKKQRFLDYDGFSWCCLHGGANSVTYKKPLIDFDGHAKLAWYANKMVFQPTIAGTGDVDVVWGPDDVLKPLVIHWGEAGTVQLQIEIKDESGAVVQRKRYDNIALTNGRNVVELDALKPALPKEGYYFIEYLVE